MALVRAVALAAVVAAVFAGAPAAAPDDDRREVRVAGTCTGSSTARLRLRAEDGRIRADARIEAVRPRATWRVLLLHERRIVLDRTLSGGATGYSVELRKIVPDWPGTDVVTLRATGRRGETCRAAATI